MMPTQLVENGSSTNILSVANMPVLWACALGVFAVIILQSVIYIRAARKAAPAAGITGAELRTSFRSGAVAAIGPSLAVVLVAIALLALFGTPAVLVRIGLIGSAAYETGAANIAATTMGATLGDATYTQQVFAVAFFAMSIGGAMWMLTTLIATPLLKRGEHKLAKVNPLIMTVVPAAALLAAFISIGIGEIPKSSAHLITLITAGVVMALCLFLAKRLNRVWLREWGLGFAIVAALFVAYAAHTAGLGPVA